MNKCGQMEVYSRVTGYMRPVNAWNKGKQEEFLDRVTYSLDGSKINIIEHFNKKRGLNDRETLSDVRGVDA